MAHRGLEAVLQGIKSAAAAAGREAASITLIAVSKTFTVREILPLIEEGQSDFGENRVQEARAKWPPIRSLCEGLKLHLIGPLQSNKAREAVRLFDAIHTIDRPKIAQAIAAEISRQDKAPELFIQVNAGREPQKAGVDPDAADGFIGYCRNTLNLEISGLMCIPPATADPRPHFELLAALARRNALCGLSMGMSADYATAIACGATHLRIGSAIFGNRSLGD
jgi:hypothetical protein